MKNMKIKDICPVCGKKLKVIDYGYSTILKTEYIKFSHLNEEDRVGCGNDYITIREIDHVL